MAQETRFAGCTSTIETADTIDTSGTIKTSGIDTVVNVYTAIGSRPTVYTNARVTAVRIRASCSVLADGRTQRTFVNVIFAKFPIVIAGTFASVRVHSIDACATVLALVARAVVDVFFTIDTLETWMVDI